ncbi:MAG: ABC transporter permease subunit [Burkholderiales bacterium]|nr:ABC transporter permease subunit [Burkholderiales bacterium]
MSKLALVFPIQLTVKVCAVSFILFFITAPPLALYFARRKTLVAKCLQFLVTLPLVFPPIALGYLLLLLLGRTGPLGSILYDSFGFRIVFSQWGVILAAFIAGLPLVVQPMISSFESSKLKEIEDAALVCGASRFKTFFIVTLPLIKNSVISGLLLGLARASGEVGVTMMLGGNTSGRTNTLSLEIYNSVSRGDFDTATNLCILLAAFALAIYLLLIFVQSKKVF